MGAFAAPVALAVAAAGTIYGGIEENRSQRAMARQDEENGRRSIMAGEEQAIDVLREARFQQGAAAASMAGSGLVFGGSVGTVLADSAYQAELDIDRIRAAARGEAANAYAQAKERRKAGKAAIIGSLFSAVSNTIAGVSDMRNRSQASAQGQRERSVRLGSTGGGASYSWQPMGGGGR